MWVWVCGGGGRTEGAGEGVERSGWERVVRRGQEVERVGNGGGVGSGGGGGGDGGSGRGGLGGAGRGRVGRGGGRGRWKEEE